MTENYLYWVSLTQTVGKCAFVTTTVSGLILIFFNLFAVKKIFGTYKYLMIIFTSMGIGLAMLEVVFHPNLHFYNLGYVYFTLSEPFHFGQFTLICFLDVYAGVYCLTISLLAVQFIYRYWAVFSLQKMSYFRGWKSLIWVVYCWFFGVQWCLGVHFLLEPDSVTKTYFKEEILRRYDVVSDELPMRAFIAYDPVDKSIRFQNWMFAFTVTYIMALQYGVMVYCGWMMYTKMEEKIATFSTAAKHHHKQLFKTLVFQITSPTIFLFSPLVMILYLPFFDIEQSFPAGATVCAFNFYPAMDVIIVLYVVTEYRIAAKKYWKRIIGCEQSNRRKNSQTTGEVYKLSTLNRTRAAV